MSFVTFFLVPPGTQCTLTEDGWIFASESSLPESAVNAVLGYFGPPFVEEFLGIRKFRDEHTQINVVLGADGLASEISLRTDLGGCAIEEIRSRLGGAVKLFDATSRYEDRGQ